MGAQTFSQWHKCDMTKTSLEQAHRDAREEAYYEYGHRGYTGSLAEKGEVVEITIPGRTTPPTAQEAEDYADRLIADGDPRVDDKWGPAGAIKCVGGWLFFGWASS